MKRVLCLVVFFVLCFAGHTYALELIDLDSLSEYELFELQAEIQDKIFEIDPNARCFMYSGVYIVGEDIDPGSYVVKLVDPNERNPVCYIDIWKGTDYNSHIELREGQIQFYPDDLSFMAQVNLHSGTSFEIHNGVYQFIKR